MVALQHPRAAGGTPGSTETPSSPGTAQPGPSSTRREAHVQAGVYAPSSRLSRPPNSNGTNTRPPLAIPPKASAGTKSCAFSPKPSMASPVSVTLLKAHREIPHFGHYLPKSI